MIFGGPDSRLYGQQGQGGGGKKQAKRAPGAGPKKNPTPPPAGGGAKGGARGLFFCGRGTFRGKNHVKKIRCRRKIPSSTEGSETYAGPPKGEGNFKKSGAAGAQETGTGIRQTSPGGGPGGGGGGDGFASKKKTIPEKKNFIKND